MLEVMAWFELEMDKEWRRSRSFMGDRFSKTLSGSLGVTHDTLELRPDSSNMIFSKSGRGLVSVGFTVMSFCSARNKV